MSMTEKLERVFWMTGAYDLTHPEPSKNYGIHGMDMYFAVKGPHGAVNLTIQTQWFLPHLIEDTYQLRAKGYPFNPAEEFCLPNIVDVGYHSKIRNNEYQAATKNCKLTDDDCYYDGSSLAGNECWREGFLHGGTDWLWSRLEQLYHYQFIGGEFPDLTPIPRKHPDDMKEFND